MTDPATFPWWAVDHYTEREGIPAQVYKHAGPHGIALVRAYKSDKTDPGWGRDTFMSKYMKGKFRSAPIMFAFNRDRCAFAFVMRSLKIVCIDIDGKNGGIEHAKRIGVLPHTLAETSKSGNGFHLFYTVEDEWDDDYGFDLLADHIGIVQGVDIRSVGCVYHFQQQKWNTRDLAPLPDYIIEMMKAKRQKQLENAGRIGKILNTQDDLEILMLQSELEQDLAKPIPAGRRNNTLFAIGQKMRAAGVHDWETKIQARAEDVGLEDAEIVKLVGNISTFA